MSIKNMKAYEVIKETDLKDFQSNGYLLRHKKSGARIALISNEDENKVFYVGFRTPPADSTGVAHIIEHSVLCGSEKFPAKDPFVELVKGSLNTFLNAMTYPDKTVYPVASCNDKDFQNLMDVYMDAVFHPNIYKKEQIFKQEGWHYELEEEHEPIRLNGVVYNEMKGAFSSPEGVLDREIMNSLFPDTAYGNESGGDPKYIPDLTYEQFLEFHKTYYHPCNSYIYLYGNMDMEEKLRWLDEEYLGKYEAIELDSSIAVQKPFGAIRKINKTYPIASNESLENNTYLSYNMVISNSLNKELYLAFELLEYVLLSMPGAPLKKALIDEGIGRDILGSYDNGIYQPMFSIVAKNANKDQEERFVEVIRNVLEEQANGGLSKKALKAALNRAEFKYREADFGSYPKGLIYGLQMFDSWLYDEEEPFLHLQASEVFDFLKEQTTTDYFENLIREYMLNNQHISMVCIEPEKGLNAKNEQELADRLMEYKNSLSKEEIHSLIQQTKALKQYQEEPSTKEELEKIPMLKREDMSREAAPIINEEHEWNDTKVLYHDIFSNKIQYVKLLFDLSFVQEEDLPYVALLRALMGVVDTENYSYTDLANEINLYIGGTGASILIYTDAANHEDYSIKYEIKVKTLYHNIGKACELLEEMMLRSNFHDEKRIREVLAEVKSRLQMSLSSAGHSYSAMRATSYFSKAARCQDLTSGVALYRMVTDLEEHFDEKKDMFMDKLEQLAKEIFVSTDCMVDVTCDTEGMQLVKEPVEKLLLHLPKVNYGRQKADITCKAGNEGFMDASKVQYVSRAGNFIDAGYEYTGVLKILKVILSYDYLWINVRVKGGAYGCGSVFTRGGNATFSSYRDPNLSKTNQIYEGIPEYIRNFDATERDMTKYIIGSISDLDIPLNPDAKGGRSLMAYLTNVSFEQIQKERDEVIGASVADIRALADLIQSVLEQKHLCVFGNEEKITKEKEQFDTIEQL